MPRKPYCGVTLEITVPLTGRGYIDGICCERLEGHKIQSHRAVFYGKLHDPKYGSESVKAVIVWDFNAAQ